MVHGLCCTHLHAQAQSTDVKRYEIIEVNMFNCNRDSCAVDTLLYHVDHVVFDCWAFPLPGVPRGVYQSISCEP